MENQQNTGNENGPKAGGERNDAPRGRGQRGPRSPRGPKGRGAPRGRRPEEKPEFDSRILDLARVTRVTKGGKRMRFRACIILGDRKGRVGYGVAKGADVQQSVSKATNQAKKNMVTVPIVDETIPFEVKKKFAAAHVLIKPAPRGTGIKAGGAARVVLEFAGIPNVVAKILGSNNKINNAKAAIAALNDLEAPVGQKKEAAAAKEDKKDEKKPAKSKASSKDEGKKEEKAEQK
jgi:small subunit ribosomal protein S5